MKFTTHLELHSQTTRLVEGVSHGPRVARSQTGFSPSMTPCSKELRPAPCPKHPLQITTRTPEGSDFKCELLPLHSPLLRQSLLVSFPPLINMLKFSGYPHLIRGVRHRDSEVAWRITPRSLQRQNEVSAAPEARRDRHCLSGPSRKTISPNTPAVRQHQGSAKTLEQVCPSEYQRAQCAFKDSMSR